MLAFIYVNTHLAYSIKWRVYTSFSTLRVWMHDAYILGVSISTEGVNLHITVDNERVIFKQYTTGIKETVGEAHIKFVWESYLSDLCKLQVHMLFAVHMFKWL